MNYEILEGEVVAELNHDIDFNKLPTAMKMAVKNAKLIMKINANFKRLEVEKAHIQLAYKLKCNRVNELENR